MKRIKKRTIMLMVALPLLGVGVLFSLIAFDRLSNSSKPLIELSVIVRDSDSSLWTAARKGMEQAAADYGAELRFLTLTASNSSEDQKKLLDREISNGADAIVIAPVDPAALGDAVQAAASVASMVTIDTDMSEYGADACVSVDNSLLALSLGNAALAGTQDGDSVIVAYSSQANTLTQLLIDETSKALREGDRKVILCSADRIGMYLNYSPPDAIIAVDSDALERVARLVQSADAQPLIYGNGVTSDIAHYLEIGIIEMIAAKNEYASGYLAVQAAVQKALNEKVAPIEYLPFYFVTNETMYEPDYQKLLFPVS
ncbi:MAG: substrate-binding domain-containing protein [Clostridia bacterium]|nr:substrate-binding domain-containing protein [Clostridia bacterium]